MRLSTDHSTSRQCTTAVVVEKHNVENRHITQAFNCQYKFNVLQETTITSPSYLQPIVALLYTDFDVLGFHRTASAQKQTITDINNCRTSTF